MSIWKNKQEPKKDYPQTTLIDEIFICFISGKEFETRQHHKKLCIYKYCKLPKDEYNRMIGRQGVVFGSKN